MSHGRCRLGGIYSVALLLAAASALSTGGCASSEGAEQSAQQPPAEESGTSEQQYGNDPMGIAQQWADELPESAPESLRETLGTWERPSVVRVTRREDGSYRAVIARSGSSEAKAVILVIERQEGRWRVTGSKEGAATYRWPEM